MFSFICGTPTIANYSSINGGGLPFTQPEFSAVRVGTPMPFAGTIKSLHVFSTSEVGNTITVYKNGSATSMSCVINGSGEGFDTTHTFTFSIGDTISINYGTAVSLAMKWNVVIESASGGSSFIGGNTNDLNNTLAANPYAGFFGYSADSGSVLGRSATHLAASNVIATSGYLSNFIVDMGIDAAQLALSGSVSNAWTFTLYKNGSATALSCTITGVGVTQNTSTATVTLSAGDTISILVSTNPGYVMPLIYGPTIQANWACDFHPTVDGQFITGNRAGGGPDGSSASMARNSPWYSGGSATLNARDLIPDNWFLQKIMITEVTAPGAGKSRTFREIEFFPTTQLVVSNSETSETWTGNEKYEDGFSNLDFVSMDVDGAAASPNTKMGFLFYRKTPTGSTLIDFFDSSGGNTRKLCN